MQLIEVNDSSTEKEFLQLPIRLYKNDPAWIRPLDQDIKDVFEPKKNKFFRDGECIRWILKDDKQTIGRVAAFFSKKTMNKDNDQPTGGIGFFECEENKEAAFLLFDQCKEWLKSKGLQAMDGPINFGERDRWWGLLVEGFDKEPNYQCNHQLPYYQTFFEDYGFQVYFKQFTYARLVSEPLSEKLLAKARKIAQDPRYTCEHIRKSNLAKYTEDFRQVYNAAWANHKGVTKMSSLQAKTIINKLKPIMDEKILWFAYFEGQPVGFFIMLPEVNQIFKHVNGKLNWLGKLKFLYHKYRKTVRKMFGVAFGIVPEHQGKGVDGAMIEASRVMVQEKYLRYDYFEMNWIGDFNPKMINVVKQVGARLSKVHHTYRLLFDETKEFKRMPIKG